MIVKNILINVLY